MSHLPQSFLGSFPLYLGVEIALGITILNKCSGFYGLLALFTGHPLDLLQWVLYLFSAFTLVVYAIGLSKTYKPDVLTFSLVVALFTLDTVLTCLFTLWFSNDWFSRGSGLEESRPELQNPGSALGPPPELVKRGSSLASQSASQGYEHSVTILFTILTLAARFYFNAILLAFLQRLLRHPKYMLDFDELQQDMKNKSFLQRYWRKCQLKCYYLCRQYLA
ncbi:LAMI_0E13784g1_1 [Lachancea mirantina]|uniref:LAMI_0E13784g1_1 n=1 Tax=Lachancea mirantina TaxID=1230905 RepID=A0A1G4JRI2_9SACH|nr:LAMI_0E13784g1_1 [Lachancea mirantina]